MQTTAHKLYWLCKNNFAYRHFGSNWSSCDNSGLVFWRQYSASEKSASYTR